MKIVAELDQVQVETDRLLRSRTAFGLEEIAERQVVAESMVGKGQAAPGTPIEHWPSLPRLSKAEVAEAKIAARGADEPPTVVSSPDPTCEPPAALLRLQAQARAAGWDTIVRYGAARLAKKRKVADAEELKAYNDSVKASARVPIMEPFMLDIASVSLRCRKGDQRAYGLWVNGMFDSAGHLVVGESPETITAAGLKKVLT